MMAKWIPFALPLLCILLLGGVVQLARDNRLLRAENRRLLDAAQQLKQQEAAGTAKNRALAQNVETLQARLARKTAPRPGAGAEPPAAETTAAPNASGPLGKMAALMKDPKMRDAMRSQQKFMLGQLYGPLFKKLTLTPEEEEQLKEILADKQMAGLALLGPDDAKAKLAMLQDARQQTDQALKTLLNEEQYKLCQDYDATLGERMVLNPVSQAFTDQGMALDEAQQEELISMMQEERQKLNLPSANEQQEAMAGGMPSEAAVEKLLQQQETLYSRVYERSAEILSEPQHTELKAQLDNQLQMQRVGLQMLKRLMSGDQKE